MLPPNDPDRIQMAFDDHRRVANAGLLLPVTLARHMGLGELVDCHVDLGDAPGRANAGDKLLTLVARLWPAVIASTTLTRCVLGAPNGCCSAWSRHRPRWEPSCAALGGATCGNWTGWAGS